MRRTERLFQIIQILRRTKRPVTGQEFASELETSLRTIYRDMAELIAQRVPIRGEAGTGYVLQDGYDMPPLMLTADEIEAAVLGAKWVSVHGDAALARGAADLMAKLSVALPEKLQPLIVDPGLIPLTFQPGEIDNFDVSLVRAAIRQRQKVHIDYADENGATTRRIIWPFAIAYTESVRMICSWCELRKGFRHFRTDRIQACRLSEDRYPERTEILRKRWKEEMIRQNREKHQKGASSSQTLPPTQNRTKPPKIAG